MIARCFPPGTTSASTTTSAWDLLYSAFQDLTATEPPVPFEAMPRWWEPPRRCMADLLAAAAFSALRRENYLAAFVWRHLVLWTHLPRAVACVPRRRGYWAMKDTFVGLRGRAGGPRLPWTRTHPSRPCSSPEHAKVCRP